MRIEKTQEYRLWLDGLKDLAGRARVLLRVDRLIHGNPAPSFRAHPCLTRLNPTGAP
jgi:putative component of toxin-antitoxin plasmid stabilization module